MMKIFRSKKAKTCNDFYQSPFFLDLLFFVLLANLSVEIVDDESIVREALFKADLNVPTDV